MLNRTFARHAILAALAVSACSCDVAWRGPTFRACCPRATVPQDKRLGKLKDLDGYFPFTPSKTPEEWATRAEQVRRRILVATGLWPMPAKTPANAVIHGKVERDGYTVERVYLESYPGHFVTGSLYRPDGQERQAARRALFPHGHWPNGRFTDAGRRRHAQADRRRGRAIRGRRPLSAASPLRAVGADGLRRVSLRHGRLCRQHADLVRAGASFCQAAARVRHARELGLLQPAGRAAAAEHHGAANLQLDSRARLAVRAARRRSGADRRDRRQRRRHADVHLCAPSIRGRPWRFRR